MKWRPLPGLTRRSAATEVLAGVTLVAIAVPLNIGYAQIAGLPPSAGLYALIVPAIVYALTVSSRQVVASPDAAAAALVASSLGGLAVAGSADYLSMAFAQAILSGVMFVLCAVLKLGFLATFLSKPILIGFVGGLALDILVSQVAKMLGITIDSGGEFVDKVVGLFGGLGTLNPWALLISVFGVLTLVIGRILAKAVPWALVVLIVATVVMLTSDLEDRGVSVLGAVEAGAPTLTWPVLDWLTWLALIPSAFALTMVTMAEGLLVSRSYGDKRGYRTSPNKDLMAFGIANVASGATGGFAVGSSTSRTAAMDQAGSRTQLPSIVAAVLTLLLMLFGTALLADIPSPAIGAIVAVAVLPLLGVPEFNGLWRASRFEFFVGASCFLGALLLGPIVGIMIAFVLALINLAKRVANPAVDVLGSTEEPSTSLLTTPVAPGSAVLTAPGLIVIRFAAPVFFANVGVLETAVRTAIAAAPQGEVKHVVFDLEAVTDIDVTGSEGFGGVKSWLEGQGIAVHYSRVRSATSALLEHFGLDVQTTTFGTNRAAIAALAGETSAEERRP